MLAPVPRVAGNIRINAVGAEINAQGSVGEDGIAKNGVVRAAVADARPRRNQSG